MVSAIFIFLLPEKSSYAQNASTRDISKEFIVVFKTQPTVSLLSSLSTTTTQDLEIKNGIAGSNAMVFAATDGDVKTAMEEMGRNSQVQAVFPNYQLNLQVVPNDPLAASASPQSQWNLYKLNLAGTGRSAWDVTTGSASIVVAVIDTGIDSTHPDFAGKIDSLIDCSTDVCSAVSSMTDAHAAGHGTHVAGLVGAVTNNATGIASAGYNTKIMVIKVMDASGNTDTDNFFNAIKWAADHGAKVINTSFGVVADSMSTVAIAEYNNHVAYAWDRGAVVVAAAGNCFGNTNGRSECSIISANGTTISGYAVNPKLYPAASPNVISVAASTVDNTIASYSERNDSSNTNIGNWISVAAPGGDGACTDSTKTCILSAVPGASLRYFWQSGSSMAAPQVAGIAALVLAVKPSFTNSQVKNIIETSANHAVLSGVTKFGLVDALAAVEAANGTVANTPTPTPNGTSNLTPTLTIVPTSSATASATPTSGPTATPTVTPYPTIPPRLPKTPPNPYPQAPYCAMTQLIPPPPGPGCCNISQINQNYKCIQDCGPPVGQAGDPPSPFRCLSPNEQIGIELVDGKRVRCPICLASNTTIATLNGNIRVTELKVGMSVWTVDRFGNKVSAPILKTSSVTVPSSHQVMHLVLSDGRNLWVSPGHPTANGKSVERLKVGDHYDGSVIVSNNLQSYWDSKTFDLLPAGDTGFYWANGILIGSTLK